MNIDDLESRVKDMTDAELEDYLRETRARRKNTIKVVGKKGEKKAKPVATPMLDQLGLDIPDDLKAAAEKMLREAQK